MPMEIGHIEEANLESVLHADVKLAVGDNGHI